MGKALVQRFLSAGWKVATFGRRSNLVAELNDEYAQSELHAVSCDMRIPGQLDHFFEEVKARFGKLDAVVLNAGVLGPEKLPFVADIDSVDLRMAFETNFFSHFDVLRRSLKLRADRQAIIHVTSDAVREAYPGWGAYGASKAAMDFLIRVLGNEAAGKGVAAMSMDPGDMDTEMHRLALPDHTGLPGPGASAGEILKEVEKLLGALE